MFHVRASIMACSSLVCFAFYSLTRIFARGSYEKNRYQQNNKFHPVIPKLILLISLRVEATANKSWLHSSMHYLPHEWNVTRNSTTNKQRCQNVGLYFWVANNGPCPDTCNHAIFGLWVPRLLLLHTNVKLDSSLLEPPERLRRHRHQSPLYITWQRIRP